MPITLFSPFTLNGLTLSNRIVMAPMTRNFSPRGVPGPDVAAYYRRRAEGGAGLILTEGTSPNHPAGREYAANPPSFMATDALAGWARVVEGCTQPEVESSRRFGTWEQYKDRPSRSFRLRQSVRRVF